MEDYVSTKDAVITYRYLRLGLVALVIFLSASIIDTRRHSDRWQNSISAYFYTSSHSVFVAALCAVGACLIIYQGSTTTEDALLNFSGLLAFVVGLVPTGREELRGPGLPDDFCPTVFVENNVNALLIASVAAGLVYGIVQLIAYVKRKGQPPAPKPAPPAIEPLKISPQRANEESRAVCEMRSAGGRSGDEEGGDTLAVAPACGADNRRDAVPSISGWFTDKAHK